MKIRQSDIKRWQTCPMSFKFAVIDQQPRLQSGAVTYGSILHDCVLFMEVNQDVEGAVDRFYRFWNDPTLLDPTYQVDYYLRGTSWRSYKEKGEPLLRKWWDLIQWDVDNVLAREHHFEVPIGDGHTLEGTVDKLLVRYVPKMDRYVLMISDYKTNRKVPTYDYLAEDLQFSAYSYATTQPEFWTGIPNGAQLFQDYLDYERHGEWVHLIGPRRMDAGIREARHYERLRLQVDAMAESVAMGIYTLNISGEACRYCDFRKICGLPEIEEAE